MDQFHLIDSHTHVNFQPFGADAPAVIERSLQQGVGLINVGSQLASSQQSVALAERYPRGVWAAVGLHPIHLFSDIVEEQVIGGKTQKIVAKAEQFDPQLYKNLALSSNKVVAMGECGLDYLHFERAHLMNQIDRLKDQQRQVLEAHLRLAQDLNLAIIIHCRDAQVHTEKDTAAFLDLLDLLKSYPGTRGVIHCYTGPVSLVDEFVQLGFYIGFTGIVTFPHAKEVQAAAKRVPLERMLLETDAPYLTPAPHRGQRNEPAYVQYVAQYIAQLRGVLVNELAQQTVRNTIELFQLH